MPLAIEVQNFKTKLMTCFPFGLCTDVLWKKKSSGCKNTLLQNFIFCSKPGLCSELYSGISPANTTLFTMVRIIISACQVFTQTTKISRKFCVASWTVMCKLK
jgi:hypothetical protein